MSNAVLQALDRRGFLGALTEHGAEYHVSPSEIAGTCRVKNISHARRHFWLWLREEHGLSYPDIGALFARDHTTVMYGVKLSRVERDRGGAVIRGQKNITELRENVEPWE